MASSDGSCSEDKAEKASVTNSHAKRPRRSGRATKRAIFGLSKRTLEDALRAADQLDAIRQNQEFQDKLRLLRDLPGERLLDRIHAVNEATKNLARIPAVDQVAEAMRSNTEATVRALESTSRLSDATAPALGSGPLNDLLSRTVELESPALKSFMKGLPEFKEHIGSRGLASFMEDIENAKPMAARLADDFHSTGHALAGSGATPWFAEDTSIGDLPIPEPHPGHETNGLLRRHEALLESLAEATNQVANNQVEIRKGQSDQSVLTRRIAESMEAQQEQANATAAEQRRYARMNLALTIFVAIVAAASLAVALLSTGPLELPAWLSSLS